MIDPKQRMKEVRAVVKDMLARFTTEEEPYGFKHFGDIFESMTDEADKIRFVIALQDYAMEQEAKKNRAGDRILKMKQELKVVRELGEYQRQAISEYQFLTRNLEKKVTYLTEVNNTIGAQLDDMTAKYEAAMTLLKDNLDG